MLSEFETAILETTSATKLAGREEIQSLWSGYGSIARYSLSGAANPSVVAKIVQAPNDSAHPRGWNTNLSHARKLQSYQVESTWYRDWSDQCDDQCRIPHCLATASHEDQSLIVLEDLDAAGFPLRKTAVNPDDVTACIDWLAHFHARFMGEAPEGLWPTGTYWHLETRPDELEALDDTPLKNAAPIIDDILKKARFQSFVHGDAKLANFCFSSGSRSVAAVDFQYVGGGCGMKDLAYFIGSCLDEAECERQEADLLDTYFVSLKSALEHYDCPYEFEPIEAEWRALFPVAWTDFHRFLKGWSPGHWKLNSYSERLARETIERL